MKTFFTNSAALLLLFLSILQSRAYEFVHDTTFNFLNTTDSFLSLFSSRSLMSQVRNIGDINGDGIDDLMIYDLSSSIYSGNGYARLIYIVFGSQTSPSSIDLDNLLAHGQGFAINGEGYLTSIYSLSLAGDINDDGIADFMLGAYCSAYVIFGRRDGFTDIINITNLTQTQGFKIYPDDTLNLYSCDYLSVSNAGDFNNDGIDDIMIGYINECPLNRHNAGIVYIIFGISGTFSDFNLTDFASGTQGLKIMGANAGEFLGLSVSSAGDFNGDGIDDVALTKNGNKLYVIYGHEAEFQDLDLSTLTKSQGFQVTDRETNKCWIVTNAGDFDGDGLNDLVFRQTGFGVTRNDAIVYLLFGAQGGYTNFDINDLHYTQDVQVLKIISNSGYKGAHHLANSVDVNGDGLSDLLFGVRDEFQVVYGRKQRISEIDLDSLTSADGFKIKNIPSNYTFSEDALDFDNDGEIDFVFGGETVSLIYTTEIQNVAAIVAAVVVPSVLVLLGIGIYVIRRRGLKKKADENKKMKPIPQTPNQDSPTALSWPTSPALSTREEALVLFKVKTTGETHLTPNMLNPHQKIENNRQAEDGEQQNNPDLCLSSLLEQVGQDEEAPPEELVKPIQVIH